MYNGSYINKIMLELDMSQMKCILINRDWILAISNNKKKYPSYILNLHHFSKLLENIN